MGPVQKEVNIGCQLNVTAPVVLLSWLHEPVTAAAQTYMQVGDAIWYEGVQNTVHSFGLLWTHLYRFNGSRVSVRTLGMQQRSGNALLGTCTFKQSAICLLEKYCLLALVEVCNDPVGCSSLRSVTCTMRYQLLRLQVPNEKLMKTDIVNVTESRNVQDRLVFTGAIGLVCTRVLLLFLLHPNQCQCQALAPQFSHGYIAVVCYAICH